MRIIKGIEIPITICIGYTTLSIINAILNTAMGNDEIPVLNSFMMLLWTSIAVLTLSIHHLFEEWSPLAMIIVQYIIAMALVLLSLFITGLFEALSSTAYRDGFTSFTIPYIIGAFIYYFNVFREAKKQNKILQEIKAQKY